MNETLETTSANSNLIFSSAQEAFETLYNNLSARGREYNETKCAWNIPIWILNPDQNEIKTPWRKWKKDYAELEWAWYLSGDPNPDQVAVMAKKWNELRDNMGIVNSNYGYQWQRHNQLSNVIQELKKNPDSRRAAISLYDGKEFNRYEKDCVCTMYILFSIVDGALLTSVHMRSCDLIWGFCNDQFCFSKLHEMVAKDLGIPVGNMYYHFNNLHIYKRHWDLKERNSK